MTPITTPTRPFLSLSTDTWDQFHHNIYNTETEYYKQLLSLPSPPSMRESRDSYMSGDSPLKQYFRRPSVQYGSPHMIISNKQQRSGSIGSPHVIAVVRHEFSPIHSIVYSTPPHQSKVNTPMSGRSVCFMPADLFDVGIIHNEAVIVNPDSKTTATQTDNKPKSCHACHAKVFGTLVRCNTIKKLKTCIRQCKLKYCESCILEMDGSASFSINEWTCCKCRETCHCSGCIKNKTVTLKRKVIE